MESIILHATDVHYQANNRKMAKFKRGASGNPNGRPKGSISITSAIRQKLSEVNPISKRAYLDDLVEVTLNHALKGDLKAIKEIWNHLDGSPRQTQELELNQTQLTGIQIVVRKDEEYKRNPDLISYCS